MKVKNSLLGRIMLASAIVAISLACASAQSTAPDASSIVTTASETFNAVGALVAAAVGFFVIVKIVKWVRK